LGPIPIGLGAATDLFCAAKAAEGASPRTIEWHRMILIRAVRRFGEARPVDAIPAAELRAWLLELRTSLAPESIAGYVRGLKAFGRPSPPVPYPGSIAGWDGSFRAGRWTGSEWTTRRGSGCATYLRPRRRHGR